MYSGRVGVFIEMWVGGVEGGGSVDRQMGQGCTGWIGCCVQGWVMVKGGWD